jgi:hypothetical protein
MKAVISIDLGATYTKVAWRKEWTDLDQIYEERSMPVKVDGEFVVPSLALKMNSAREENWYFGLEAARMKLGKGSTLHLDWKSKLYREHLDRESVAAVQVAGRFFKWLREKLKSNGLPVDRARVRLSVPAFDEKRLIRVVETLAQCMRDNGWRNEEIFKVEEPTSNLLGLATGGHNFTLIGERSRAFNLNYAEMMPPGSMLVAAARNAALHAINDPVGIAILDIGSFTTDVAFLRFDPSSPDDYFKVIEQTSVAKGVLKYLDLPLFELLAVKTPVDLNELPFEEREQIKSSLFSVTPRPYTLGRASVLDGLSLKPDTDQMVETFASAIADAVRPAFDKLSPDRICITGGGRHVRNLTSRLLAKLAHGNPQKKLREFPIHSMDFDLTRLAGALGGASIILDRPVEDAPKARHARPIETGFQLLDCSCQGGNKDCMFCAGSGYRRVRRR